MVRRCLERKDATENRSTVRWCQACTGLESAPAVVPSGRFRSSSEMSVSLLLPSVKVKEGKTLLDPNPLSLVLTTPPPPHSLSKLLKKILYNVIFNFLPSSLC